MDPWRLVTSREDPGMGDFPPIFLDDFGRFRAEPLVSGLAYTAQIDSGFGRSGGVAFSHLKLAPGEVRDLGDIRAGPFVDLRNVRHPAR